MAIKRVALQLNRGSIPQYLHYGVFKNQLAKHDTFAYYLYPLFAQTIKFILSHFYWYKWS